jgi:uncharacterized secreted protein with C-terminal beta-propeller domain
VFAAALGGREGDMRAAAPPGAANGAKTPAYSGTNTHEAGVDEPDLVKTDGRRIVTVLGDTLSVIDAATRRRTGSLKLDYGTHQLLLHGDRAVVLTANAALAIGSRMMPGRMPQATHVRLIDLSGSPKVIGTYDIDAGLTDARQTGSMVRVVVRSRPVINFPWPNDLRTDAQRLAANRKIIDSAPLESWLPAYKLNGKAGQVDCGDVSRPDRFSGASLVTVLSFDLAKAALGDGAPTAVLADAETVYGNGPNLYLAHDERWRGPETTGRTELFQFDVTGARPAFVAAGSVPGWLLNQYSLSEHDGVLRAATTTGHPWQSGAKSDSAVYTLRRDGGSLRLLGHVSGLGKGEQIYAVRFVGLTGYVVTFRQTDPLYAVDLRDPAHPRVTGALKIPGYSAYLHPVDGNRLIGVGQDATEQGRVQGMQVSLFDVGSADPRRLDQHKVPGGWSEAENDPHAFLYWPAERLLVVPVANYASRRNGVLLLRVQDTSLTEVAWVSLGEQSSPRRSLVIEDTLWVISDGSALATSIDGKHELGRVRL